MQIDWLTVAAQIVNFLVLVWLLKRFLYRPIMGAMAGREARIAERLQEARAKREAAEAEERKYHEQQAELERQREELLEAAGREAQEEARRRREEALEETRKAKHAWLQELEEEKGNFLEETQKLAAERFLELARHALADLADAHLEDQMVAALARRLREIDESALEKLRRAAIEAEERVVVQSRFGLSAERRRELTRVIHEMIGESIEVAYLRSDGLRCGIELAAGGERVVWTLEAYLDKLEAELREALEQLAPKSEQQVAA
jgi:F-type H+-transporting ATPase subunit b